MTIQSVLHAVPETLREGIGSQNPVITTQIENFLRRVVESLLSTSEESGIFPEKTLEYTGPVDEPELHELVEVSMGYIQDMWTEYFKNEGKIFTPPQTVLYNISTLIGNTIHERDMGPCYDPHSQSIYFDPLFFETFRSNIYPGCEDATILMILAHEMAHYIQDCYFEETEVHYIHEGVTHTRKLLNVLDLADFSLYHHFESTHQASQILELHADFLTGVCLRIIHERNIGFLHHDDFFEVAHAKSLIGDDMLQMLAGKTLTPESYMHGRFDQRVLALAQGFKSGNPFHFSIDDIAKIFFREGVLKPAHESVEMFQE